MFIIRVFVTIIGYLIICKLRLYGSFSCESLVNEYKPTIVSEFNPPNPFFDGERLEILTGLPDHHKLQNYFYYQGYYTTEANLTDLVVSDTNKNSSTSGNDHHPVPPKSLPIPHIPSPPKLPSNLVYEDAIYVEDKSTFFFGESIANNEEFLIVSAKKKLKHGNIQSVVHLFSSAVDKNGSWIENSVIHSKNDYNDGFGDSIVISERFVVIGAPFDHSSGYSIGLVYVFNLLDDYNGKSPVTFEVDHYQVIAPQDLTRGSIFGKSIAIDDNTLVIGAPGFSSQLTGPEAGQVIIYAFNEFESRWQETQRIFGVYDSQDSTSFAYAHFGSQVSLLDDGILGISAPGLHKSSGGVFIYTISEAIIWELQCQIIPDDLTPDSYFGYVMSFKDSVALISSFDSSRNGQVYVYQLDGGSESCYSLVTKLVPVTSQNSYANNGFGKSLLIFSNKSEEIDQINEYSATDSKLLNSNNLRRKMNEFESQTILSDSYSFLLLVGSGNDATIPTIDAQSGHLIKSHSSSVYIHGFSSKQSKASVAILAEVTCNKANNYNDSSCGLYGYSLSSHKSDLLVGSITATTPVNKNDGIGKGAIFIEHHLLDYYMKQFEIILNQLTEDSHPTNYYAGIGDPLTLILFGLIPIIFLISFILFMRYSTFVHSNVERHKSQQSLLDSSSPQLEMNTIYEQTEELPQIDGSSVRPMITFGNNDHAKNEFRPSVASDESNKPSGFLNKLLNNIVMNYRHNKEYHLMAGTITNNENENGMDINPMLSNQEVGNGSFNTMDSIEHNSNIK
eukprot:gene6853-9384_t